MKTANVTVQIVTGTMGKFDESLKKVQDNFHYVSEVMLVAIDVHALDAPGPLLGFFLNVPQVVFTDAFAGDYFIPFATSHQAPLEKWFDGIVKSFAEGELEAHSSLLKQAYEAGPGPHLHTGDGKLILKNQTVRVLKRWTPSYEDNN